ncbi:hypothetical protein K7X08_016805 [Anisodus acutangulus]|uniref:Uncharacterized protein n=1 Tax=Anisodus acutangulus TaxID=402998 RepID=A0A9Q1R4E6_9SOLA|nr:hypothetical protein K7X08_016805 [Anisodus acutangulus]
MVCLIIVWFIAFKFKVIDIFQLKIPLFQSLIIFHACIIIRVAIDLLKTATLALVLVGLFIIALSSVDSALSYMLALFLRRTA